MSADAAFFQQYDTLGQEELSLTGIEQTLGQARKSLDDVTRAEHNTENKNKALAKKIQERKELIKTCEGHWFFGSTVLQPQLWFRGGVEGKIKRQKEKLARDEAALPGMIQQERQLEAQMAAQQQQVNGLAQTNARKQQLTAQRTQMFEQAVATYPTPQYQQLTMAVQQGTQAVAAEQQAVQQMQRVVSLCEGARNKYMQGIRDLRSANQQNRQAQRDNMHDGAAAEHWERMEQERRDRLMRQAQNHANQAAGELQQGLGAIPPVARGRHPQLCAGLGVVNLPQLQQMGAAGHMLEAFGGDRGDMVAGMMAGGMIHQNIQIMQQCENMTQQQLRMAQALLNACRQDQAAAAASLQSSQMQLVAEKQRIFDGLRAAAGVPYVMPAGAAVAVATPMMMQPGSAADHFAASTVQTAFRNRPVAAATAVAMPGENGGAVAMGMPVGAGQPQQQQPAMATAMPVQPQQQQQPAMATAMPMQQQQQQQPGAMPTATATVY